MNEPRKHYRFIDDEEPDEHELAALMHDVAVHAEKRATLANQELQNRINLQTSEALAREGYPLK